MASNEAGGEGVPGARGTAGPEGRRRGPFWVEEPGWYRLLALVTFLLGLALFLLAVGFDRP